MTITDILKTIFTFLSIILTGGYLLADLHTRNAMMKYSGDLQYDIAFHYSQLRTTCIIGFMGAIGFTVICMDHFFDSISIQRLIIHGLFNLLLVLMLINIYVSMRKMDKFYKCVEQVESSRRANKRKYNEQTKES